MSGVSGAALLSPSSSGSGRKKRRERYVTGSWSDRGIMVCEKKEEEGGMKESEGKEEL